MPAVASTSTAIKVLCIIFDTEIAAGELSAFRGAVATKVGTKHVLFHNHFGDDDLRYAYPLIQYKRIGKKAAFVALGEGVDEVHHFFTKRDWSLDLNGRPVDMRVDRLHLDQYLLQVWDTPMSYRLHNWLALNEKNYQLYQQSDHAGQIALLERMITGNILAFAKGVGWHISSRIMVHINDLPEPVVIRYKGTPVLAFNPTFDSNVSLPPYIGLGKSPSHGFGTVYRNTPTHNNQA